MSSTHAALLVIIVLLVAVNAVLLVLLLQVRNQLRLIRDRTHDVRDILASTTSQPWPDKLRRSGLPEGIGKPPRD